MTAIKIDGREYELVESPNLGELRLGRKLFDVNASEEIGDPLDAIMWLIYITLRRDNQTWTHDQLMEHVDAIEPAQIEGLVAPAPETVPNGAAPPAGA